MARRKAEERAKREEEAQRQAEERGRREEEEKRLEEERAQKEREEAERLQKQVHKHNITYTSPIQVIKHKVDAVLFLSYFTKYKTLSKLS